MLMQDIEMNTDGPSFGDTLNRLKEVLETEHHALIDGDAKQVAVLAREKEQVAASLMAIRSTLPEASPFSREITDLAKRVEELAQLNHMLLQQLYQQYNGMVEMFMRLAGLSQTYGKDGTLTIESHTLKRTQIQA